MTFLAIAFFPSSDSKNMDFIPLIRATKSVSPISQINVKENKSTNKSNTFYNIKQKDSKIA